MIKNIVITLLILLINVLFLANEEYYNDFATFINLNQALYIIVVCDYNAIPMTIKEALPVCRKYFLNANMFVFAISMLTGDTWPIDYDAAAFIEKNTNYIELVHKPYVNTILNMQVRP